MGTNEHEGHSQETLSTFNHWILKESAEEG